MRIKRAMARRARRETRFSAPLLKKFLSQQDQHDAACSWLAKIFFA
jgi:hypothetical protein